MGPPALTLPARRYLSGAIRWFRELNFTGPMSFAVNAPDDGLPAPPGAGASEPAPYCLHGSYPPWGCAGAVVLPLHSSHHSHEALAWLRAEGEQLVKEVPFVNRTLAAIFRGSPNGAYRQRWVD